MATVLQCCLKNLILLCPIVHSGGSRRPHSDYLWQQPYLRRAKAASLAAAETFLLEAHVRYNSQSYQHQHFPQRTLDRMTNPRISLPYTFPSSRRQDVEAPPCTSLRYSPSRTHFPARRQDVVAPPCTSLRHSSHTTPVHTSQLSPSRRGSTPCTSPVHLPYTFPSSGRHDVEAPPCTSLRYSPSLHISQLAVRRGSTPCTSLRYSSRTIPVHISQLSPSRCGNTTCTSLRYSSHTPSFPALAVTTWKHRLQSSPVQLLYTLPGSRRQDVETPPCTSLRHSSRTIPVHISQLSPSRRGSTPCTSLRYSSRTIPIHISQFSPSRCGSTPCTSHWYSSSTTPVHISQLSLSRRGSTPGPLPFSSSHRHDKSEGEKKTWRG